MEAVNENKSNLRKRVILYLLGMIILAFGITLNTKVSLGVSPIISIAYCISVIASKNFGDMCFLVYGLLVLIQVIAHLIVKDYKRIVNDLLQLIVSLIFSRILNVFSYVLPCFKDDFPGTVWATLWARILILLVAIICTGIGAALTLNMRLIPNPGDGIVQTFADITGKGNGLIKNCLDISCVCITLLLGLLLTRSVIGIGIGTLVAMLGVGRVIWAFNKICRI